MCGSVMGGSLMCNLVSPDILLIQFSVVISFLLCCILHITMKTSKIRLEHLSLEKYTTLFNLFFIVSIIISIAQYPIIKSLNWSYISIYGSRTYASINIMLLLQLIILSIIIIYFSFLDYYITKKDNNYKPWYKSLTKFDLLLCCLWIILFFMSFKDTLSFYAFSNLLLFILINSIIRAKSKIKYFIRFCIISICVAMLHLLIFIYATGGNISTASANEPFQSSYSNC